jgi:hypothetical protein
MMLNQKTKKTLTGVAVAALAAAGLFASSTGVAQADPPPDSSDPDARGTPRRIRPARLGHGHGAGSSPWPHRTTRC